ncbi:site-specific integrase [Acidocella sp. KAb 2-4]|uniref:tyrosine-type recombinase/integrase n=1 Tax=Acidocella sp. KAb 2-4 TaxID=2885158 RepID=UPI001D0809C6|nr:site-specific integrase [Acidocella sp. KAb 2-4]MCB5946095.1 site-specific integrase [Acidocella sp. KAb 2-4]
MSKEQDDLFATTATALIPATSSKTRVALPYDEWPPQDRAVWERALTASGLFDKAAPLAGLKPPTIDGRRKAYAAFLQYLAITEPAALERPLAERVTPPRMFAYIEAMRRRLRASSLKEEINRLISLLNALAPSPAGKKSWAWIRQLPNAPTPAEVQTSKRPITPPDPAVAITAALRLFDEADAKPTSRRHSTDARDGLLVAMAGLFALRRKNLQEIERGEHLLMDGSTIRLTFRDTVKNQQPLLFDVPDWLRSRLERYLTVHRPRLLNGDRDHGHLWVSLRKRPLSAVMIGQIFQKFGRDFLDTELNIHAFRHAMANTIVLRDPGDIDLAAAALGHRTVKMVTEVYTQSAGEAMGRLWHQRLRERTRRLGLED